MLEINPEHPVVQRLNRESDTALFADWSQILFDQALLAEGGELEDPAAFVKRLNSLTLALAGGGASKIWGQATSDTGLLVTWCSPVFNAIYNRSR